MTAMATPPRFTVTMPHKQLRLPTTLQRVRKKTPVQPSDPPPPHLLNARPKATAKASGGGGASGCGCAVGTKGKGAAVKDTSKAAKINLTEYLARYQLKRIRREWHAQFEVVAHDILDTWKKCTKLLMYGCQEECPPSCSTRSPTAWSTSSWLWSIQARRLASGRTRPRGTLLAVGCRLRRNSHAQHRTA